MRILHTSDWHLGKRLEHFSRLPEQRQVLDEIVGIAEREAADIVLITGDLFDSFNPPVEAQELFYSTLKKLSKGGSRPVIVIAGNHDSADSIQAPDPLARLHGILLIGYPGTSIPQTLTDAGITLSFPAPGLVEIEYPEDSGLPKVRIIATPYANERRLERFLRNGSEADAESDAPAGLPAGSSEGVEPAKSSGPSEPAEPRPRGEKSALEDLIRYWNETARSYFEDSTINILMGHLFAIPPDFASKALSELQEPEDERPILYPGGLAPVRTDAFPEGSQYVALGHLHKLQEVPGETCPVYYSGSPLAYSLSEAEQEKNVLLVDVDPGAQAQVKKVPLESGRRILRPRFQDVEKAIEWLKEHQESYVELKLELDSFLESGDRQRIYKAHPYLLALIPELRNAEIKDGREKVDIDKPMEELFADYFASENQGLQAPEELLSLFREVLDRRHEPGEAEGG